MFDPPVRQKSPVGGFGRNLFERKERFDSKCIERIEHKGRDPQVGNTLEDRPAGGEERKEINTDEEEQPGTHANDKRLCAIVRQKTRGQA